MQIEFLPNLLRVHFQQELIRILQYEPDGYLTVVNPRGETIARFSTMACVAYNAQYGTPISKDGQFVFVGTWRKGLFCYSIKDQKLVWKVGPGRVRNILVNDHDLLIEMAGRGIYRRDLCSGELVEITKIPSISTFKQLNANHLFAGPSKGSYGVFELPSMQPLKQIKARYLNVNDCLSFIIRDVYYQGQILFVKGFEQYEGWNDQDEEMIEFDRPILFS